jgi:hypothetical protein
LGDDGVRREAVEGGDGGEGGVAGELAQGGGAVDGDQVEAGWLDVSKDRIVDRREGAEGGLEERGGGVELGGGAGGEQD